MPTTFVTPARFCLAQRALCAAVCLAICPAISFASESSGPNPKSVPKQPAPVSFRNDVMAVLSKAGCNMGVCHGNKFGKGGFKLSLRGEDPHWDFDVLSRDQNGRRVNALEPDSSLILLKATMQVPHEGARRFRVSSR